MCGNPQENLEFYRDVLGLRLVKLTVNFDDPGTYHFYFGDEAGRPGTLLTLFPWPDTARGRRGSGQVTAISFAVPQGCLDYWCERFRALGVPLANLSERLGEQVLGFAGPDGLQFELIPVPGDGRAGWPKGTVPADCAIRGLHGVTVTAEGFERSAALLTRTMGLRLATDSGSRFRFAAADGQPGAILDILCEPDGRRGKLGAGIVHHLAWRCPDDQRLREWRDALAREGLNVTPVLDRQYFHSIYFREPGGVLFELATDGPGFAVDETPDRLGSALMLPPWMEGARAEIEASLPDLKYQPTDANGSE
jgi:glyoxalase family protein